MVDPHNPTPASTHRDRGGYPLSALFLLIAVLAVLMGSWATSLRDVFAGKDVDVFAIAWVVVLVPLGSLIGLFHHRRALGFVVGLGCGAVTAALVAPLTQLSADRFASLFLLTLVGSAVVVIVAMFCHVNQPAKSQREGQANED